MMQRKYDIMRGGGGAPHSLGPGGETHKAGLGQSLQQFGQSDSNRGGGGLSGHSSTPPLLQTHSSSTPLSSSSSSSTAQVEELSDVYKRLSPELRKRRLLTDLGDFFGI